MNVTKIDNSTTMYDDMKLNALVNVIVIMIIQSLLANLFVLFAFIKNDKLRKPVNFFIISLTILNLITACFYLPFLASGIHLRKVPFGELGCKLEGFLLLFLSTSITYMLLLLSIERYFLIFKPLCLRRINFKKCFITLFTIEFLIFVWCCFPLFGWSQYTYGKGCLNCVMDYSSRLPSTLLYTLLTNIFLWLLPFTIIIYTNIKLFRIFSVKSRQPTQHLPIGSKLRMKKTKRNQLILVMSLNVGYVLSWTPYVFVIYYSIFADPNKLNFYIGVISITFAISIVVWCPILEMIYNVNIRKNLLLLYQPDLDCVDVWFDSVVVRHLRCNTNDTPDETNLSRV